MSSKSDEVDLRRRAFIEKAAFASATAAVAAVGAGGFVNDAQAQQRREPASNSGARGLVIDCEHHIKQWGQGAVTPQQSIEWMDSQGIDMGLVTTHVMPYAPIEVVRESNDLLARWVRDNPRRHIGCATMPVINGVPDVAEVRRVVRELGMRSVYIAARPGDPGPLFLDSREMWPFYEVCQDLNVRIKVEITNSGPGMDELRQPEYHLAYPLHHMFARELDMAQAVLRLVLGGVLERFPRLTFLMDHYGGGVSTIVDRLDQYWNGYEPRFRVPFYFDQPLISRPWRDYFNMLYFGMAGRGTSTDTLKMCLVNIRPDKIMYATDWPFVGDNANLGRDLITNIRAMNLPQAEIDGILGGNAARVFGVSR